jgi:hypothetical protein
MVRNRLKTIPLCDLLDKEDPDTGLVLDQIVIGKNIVIQREETIDPDTGVRTKTAKQGVWIFSPQNLHMIQVPFLQVKQEILLHLVLSNYLDANGVNPTPPSQVLSIHLVFNVSLRSSNQTQGGGPLTLRYSFSHVDFGELFPNLPKEKRQDIEQMISGIQLPETTLDLGGPLNELLHRKVAAVNAGITCDPAGTFVALWVDFDIYSSPDVISQEFFTAGPANLLAGRDWSMLIDAALLTEDARAMAETGLKKATDVRIESGPHASWDLAGPAISISAGVELIDACPVLETDMDADVGIRVTFSVPQPGTLRRHIHIKGHASNTAEEIGCALTGALLWPFVGPVFLKDEDTGTGIAAYLAGVAGGPLLTFFGLLLAIDAKGLTQDLSDDLGNTCKKQDDENYECDDKFDFPIPLSPGSQSVLAVDRVFGVPQGLVLSGLVHGLTEPYSGTVSVTAVPFQWTVFGDCNHGFAILNQAQIVVEGSGDGGLCKVRVLSDQLNEFEIARQNEIVNVRPRFGPDYAKAPYNCRVRVITNHGVRTITFVPPKGITEEERNKLEPWRENFTKVCQIYKDSFSKPMDWTITKPGPVEKPNFQFWQFAVRDLRDSDVIQVSKLTGETLLTARPSRSGLTHFSLMFPDDRAPSRLILSLPGRKEQRDETLRMSGQQILFEHQVSLRARGQLRGMWFEARGRRRRLIIRDQDHEMAWDVTAPQAPALLSSAPLSSDDNPDAIILNSGRRVGAEPTPALLHALERMRDRLGRLEAIASPRVAGVRDPLYVRTDRGATLYDISGSGPPRELHVYEQPAWFEGVALGGDLMARHDPGNNVIELYAATATESFGSAARQRASAAETA